jgi:hypothetical protein
LSVEWQYNSRGAPKQRLYSKVNGGISHQSVEKWQYDQRGRLIHYRYETSEDLPEPFPERSEYTLHYEFSDGGEVVGKVQLSDEDGDGLVNRTTRWRYDSNGNMIHYESDGDVPPWSRSNPNRTVDYHYDAENQLIREVVDRDNDGAVDIVISYYYDAAGKLLRLEEDVDDDGTLDGVDRWLYNDAGQVTRYERRNHGQLFSIEERRYDAVGNLVYSSEDWRADGIVEQEIQLDYSADGGSIRAKLVYRDYEGLEEHIVTRVYSPTGWGHLFLLLPTSEPQDYEYAWYDPL